MNHNINEIFSFTNIISTRFELEPKITGLSSLIFEKSKLTLFLSK